MPPRTRLNAAKKSKEQQEPRKARVCVNNRLNGSIVVRKPSISHSLHIYRPERSYPFQIGLQKDSKLQTLLYSD